MEKPISSFFVSRVHDFKIDSGDWWRCDGLCLSNNASTWGIQTPRLSRSALNPGPSAWVSAFSLTIGVCTFVSVCSCKFISIYLFQFFYPVPVYILQAQVWCISNSTCISFLVCIAILVHQVLCVNPLLISSSAAWSCANVSFNG